MPYHPSPRIRHALTAAVLLSSTWLAGCPPVQKPTTTMPADTATAGVPVFGAEPVAGGIFVSLNAATPLTGPALERARADRAAIRAAVNRDVATPPPTTAPATTAAAEAPPPAVKYYLQGREKFLDGANTEAMEFLEKALELDPNAFTVLRLMGRVCFASSQLARGSLYLQRAQQAHPDDVEVNYLLGRYWLERKDNDRAIFYLLHADDSPEKSTASAQTPMVAFYLARAFQAAGYHQAAALQYRRFLQITNIPVPGYRFDRELNYLIDEPWATHLSIAENEALVGDYRTALAEYRHAVAGNAADVYIASRLINAEFHLRDLENARWDSLAVVSATHGADEALQLLAWVYKTEHHEDQLVTDLHNRLSNAGSTDAAPTLTLAATLDYMGRKTDAFATLSTYLASHPADLTVLGRLLKRVDDAAGFAKGLAASAEAIEANPAATDDVLKLFLPTAQLSLPLPPPATSRPFEQYLRALAAQSQHADPAVIDAAFADAVRLKPDFIPAREGYVSWLLAQEKYAQASTLIEQTVKAPNAGAKSWQLLIESEAAQQRLAHALQLSQEARTKFPADADLVLQLATIYRLRSQFTEAEKELNHLVDEFPKFEPGYKALINTLFARAQDEGQAVSGTLAAIVPTLGRMNRELPDSKYAQVTSATLYARAGRYEEAETMLRKLLIDAPDDPDILIPLAQVRQLLGHPDDAGTLLADALKRKPTARIAESLVSLYRDQNKAANAETLADKLVHDHPESDAFALLQASLFTAQHDFARAIPLLQAAAQRLPHSQDLAIALARAHEANRNPADAIAALEAFIHANGETPERVYLLSHFYSAAEKDDAAVAALQRVLILMPDHTGANNDLGYFWVDAGIHLDQAQRMITKALDNEPNNSAFLDSLGWLYYKQGKFADAIPQFEHAIARPDGMEAEVVQHLADTLYRADRKPEAFERWTQASSLLSGEPDPLPKSRQKLKIYLDQVRAAYNANTTPSLSPTANDPKPQSAGPTTLPTTTSH